ncbi:MAG: phosphate propanoyltransferase [Oscillospiraceae bacterium]|nr:phosphate propanoyltransferase [Oscillospiraceae bacterium]
MEKTFIVETSARHIHLTREHVDILFGKGFCLTNKKELSQPGQFATNERLTIVGSKGELKGVTILGPERVDTQIEISATDARSIGINAPIRESGDIKDSAGCRLVGPNGEVEISQGVIIAKRHIHLTKKDAENFGVNDRQVVWVEINTDKRKAILGDVFVRVSDSFSPAMHIDTDEANALGFSGNILGKIVKYK